MTPSSEPDPLRIICRVLAYVWLGLALTAQSVGGLISMLVAASLMYVVSKTA
jgi:hypothetical protein